MFNANRVRATSNCFSRSTANESKLGAYYTDVPHCNTIRGLFKFPEEEEVCVFEPSIGNGAAVIAATGADINPNIKIFGVELNNAVAEETNENPHIVDVVSADFTNGVRIQNDFFTFCFGNPPYMADEDEEEGRLEKTFLERVTAKYLKKGGILVWVIPYSRFADASTVRYLMNHYEFLDVFRFRENEYRKWHQVVFIGRKTENTFHDAEEVLSKAKEYAYEEMIPVLPDTFEGTELFGSIEVMPSDSSKLKLFTSLEFDAEGAYKFLASFPDLSDYYRLVDDYVTVPEYDAGDIGSPPIPLKKDSLYLLATSGAGQGEVGTEGVDLHLQRGVAEIVENISYEADSSNADKEVMVVTTSTEVSMTIVETSGRITTLK